MSTHNVLMLAVGAAALAVFAVLAAIGSVAMSQHRADFNRHVGRQLRDLFITIDPARLWILQCTGALTIAGLVASITWNPFAAGASAVLAMALPRLAITRLQHRRRQKLRQQVPDLLMVMAGSLRSGSGLSVALSRTASVSPAPARQHLEWLLGDLKLGISLADALTAFERRAGTEEATLAATAIRVGAETGGPLARTLESLADAIRRRLALESRIRALTAQGRLQAWIMALLPALVLALLALVDPPSFSEMVMTSGGRVVLAAVFAGQIVGFRWVRRIVAIEV